VVLRPLGPADFGAYAESRAANVEWLTRWEPKRLPGQPDPARSYDAFVARCSARHRERQLGTGYGFGIFLDGVFCGEMNLSGVQRGPFQSASIGYWVDHRAAGRGLCPESLVVVLRFAFEELALHRVLVAIVPRNHASRRVVEKVGVRCEGTAVGFLEISGVWEDHLQFAMVAEEWVARAPELLRSWVDGAAADRTDPLAHPAVTG